MSKDGTSAPPAVNSRTTTMLILFLVKASAVAASSKVSKQ
jgi:hypothetical protein